MKQELTANEASLESRVNEISRLLEEEKALDVVCLDVSRQSGGGFTDRLFILTANSPRHARAVASAISSLCHEQKWEFLGVEGQELGEWVLVDLNDIVVSIFLESTRALYRLEDMWSQLPREDTSNGNTLSDPSAHS